MTEVAYAYEWLPNLELFRDHGNDWNRYVEALYSIFKADFVETKPRFRGSRLGLKRHPVRDGREATFWHMISTGEVEEERTPEFRRCERLRWAKPSIENCDVDNIKVWEEHKRYEDRIYIWLEDESYLVVLAKRKGYILPWTAFYVDRDHTRRRLQRAYERNTRP